MRKCVLRFDGNFSERSKSVNVSKFPNTSGQEYSLQEKLIDIFGLINYT